MALFNTPDYSHIIWRKETFPEEGGIEGFMQGITGGLKNSGQYKSDKKKWDAMSEDERKKSGMMKPSPFRYFFGAGQTSDFGDMTNAINGIADGARGGFGGFGGF